MSALARERCSACQPGAPSVSGAERVALLSQIPDWEVRDEHGTPVLVRLFVCKDFAAALRFANAIGEMADAEDHHPRLVVEWGRLEVSWWTHVIGGLHRNDFILAARTDALAATA
ncbi:MAG: 4a-hydroxytetrahydrobiopterin dehydratase [Pseudomonadales bacterium]